MIRYLVQFIGIILMILPFYLALRKPWRRERRREIALGMFMPWGFGLTLLWKKNRNLWVIALYSLGLTALIESVQLFIGRSVDIDDLILNFGGSCLGAGVCHVLRRKFPGLADLAK